MLSRAAWSWMLSLSHYSHTDLLQAKAPLPNPPKGKTVSRG